MASFHFRQVSQSLTDTLSLWPSMMGWFLLRLVGVVLEWSLPVFLWVLLFVPTVGWWAALGWGAVLWLVLLLVRALVEAHAMARFANVCAPEQPVEEGPLLLLRAVGFFWGTLPLEACVSAWKAVAWVATLWAYGQALGTGAVGAASSMALAAVGAVSLPLSFVWEAWRRLAWVKEVAEPRGLWASFYEAADVLSRRFWAFGGLSLALGFLGFLVAIPVGTLLQSVAAMEGSLTDQVLMASAGQLAGGLFTAFLLAVLEMAQIAGYVRLALERQGGLPPVAQWVPEARWGVEEKATVDGPQM